MQTHILIGNICDECFVHIKLTAKSQIEVCSRTVTKLKTALRMTLNESL